MRHFAATIFLLFGQLISAQTPFPDPDDILRTSAEVPRVLLVGTFHMDYPDLDAHVTVETDRVDVEATARQREMRALLDYLARFRPTHVAVERWPGSNENQRYQAFLAGELTPGRGEIQQIGYRLAQRFGLPRLELIDAGTLVGDLYRDSTLACLHPHLDSIYADWDFKSDEAIARRYRKMYTHEDQLLGQVSLLDWFLYQNSPKRIRRGHGAYLHGDFELGRTRGADALALHWYVRNLRIFRNLQRIDAGPGDRILVLIGAGHLGILRQQLESSPAFELVEFGSLEGW